MEPLVLTHPVSPALGIIVLGETQAATRREAMELQALHVPGHSQLTLSQSPLPHLPQQARAQLVFCPAGPSPCYRLVGSWTSEVGQATGRAFPNQDGLEAPWHCPTTWLPCFGAPSVSRSPRKPAGRRATVHS